MQLNSLLKAGSLLFNVVQDDKIRELVKIAHHGAKRRGFFNGWQAPPVEQRPRIPFSPSTHRRPWW